MIPADEFWSTPAAQITVAALVGAAAFFLGWMLLGIIVGVTGSYEITRGPNYWLSPSLCLIFAGYLTYLVLAGRQPNLETRELRDYWSR